MHEVMESQLQALLCTGDKGKIDDRTRSIDLGTVTDVRGKGGAEFRAPAIFMARRQLRKSEQCRLHQQEEQVWEEVSRKC